MYKIPTGGSKRPPAKGGVCGFCSFVCRFPCAVCGFPAYLPVDICEYVYVYISEILVGDDKNGHETAKYGPNRAQNLRPRSCTHEYQFRDPRIYKNIAKFAIYGGVGCLLYTSPSSRDS